VVGWLLGAACAVLIVIGLGLLIVHGWTPLLDLDATMASAVHQWALSAAWVVEVSRGLAYLGRGEICTPLAVIALALLMIARRWRTTLWLVIVATCAPWISDRVKAAVERPRPTWPDSLATETTFSYPSGHATAGLAVWAACGIACARLIRKRSVAVAFAVPWVIVGIAIGMSRVVLGVHWPSDVVAGWCLALAVALGVAGVIALGGSIFGARTGARSARERARGSSPG